MKRIGIIVLVIVVLAGSWLLYSRGTQKPLFGQVQTQASGVKTVKVARTAIESTIDSTGTLSAERVLPLGFTSSGTVKEVLVKQGDDVVTGQTLARLDTTDLELAVKQAEVSLQSSEASLAKAKKGPSEEDIAAAKAAVASAQANLADLQAPLSDLDKQLADLSVTQAQNSLASAQANLDSLNAGPTDIEKQLAQASIDQAKDSLWGAQASRDGIAGNKGASGSSKTSAEAQVASAETGVQVAQLNYDKLMQPPKDTDIAAAQSQVNNALVAVKTAQLNRDKQTQPAKESAIASARSQLVQAESSLAGLLASPKAEDIAVAEAQVAQAQVGLESAKNKLSDAIMAAPFDGQVVSWNVYVNDPAGAAVQVGSLADLSRNHVDVSIDETQISDITVGQTVHVTLDAFPEQEITGTVSAIDQLSTVTQGIVNYNVRVDIAGTDLPLRPGMTAAIGIVTQRKDNVLSLPTNVVRRDAQGAYVEVMRLGQPVRVNITTGLSSDEATEVVSGLQEGDDVVLSGATRRTVPGGPVMFGGG